MKAMRAVRVVMLVMVLLGLAGVSPVSAAEPAWSEPQALSIVDIAGQVPDSVLSGHIVSSSGAGGVVLFQSSEITGDTLRITVRCAPRYKDWYGGLYMMNTLGQIPVFDHVASTMPAATVRLYLGTEEITDDVRKVEYLAPGPYVPSTSAAAWDRYPELEREADGSSLMCRDGLSLPANMGGTIWIDRPSADEYNNVWITAVYEMPVPDATKVRYLGTSACSFQSFIGDFTPGDEGTFGPVVDQLKAKYPYRHPRIPLNAPAGTNYVLFNFPPADFNIYGNAQNALRPMGGTVRLAPDDGMLSQNLQHGGAFPLDVVFQDSDQSAGPYLSLMPEVDRFTPPEYFVPPGIPYNPCFTEGNCPDAVLDEIYNATVPISVVYLEVTPNAAGVKAVSLKAADDTYWAGLSSLSELRASDKTSLVVMDKGAYQVSLPLIMRQVPLEINVTRPAGIFDEISGRMVGYVR